METQVILNVIDVYILLGIGVILIGLEAVITSFILFWFGLGFILCAPISYYYKFTDGIWQLAIVSIISLFLLFMFRKKAMEKFLKPKEEISDDFLNEVGIGEIRNSKVYFKGTYWEIDSENKDETFEEGTKVQVIKTYKNFAIIKK